MTTKLVLTGVAILLATAATLLVSQDYLHRARTEVIAGVSSRPVGHSFTGSHPALAPSSSGTTRSIPNSGPVVDHELGGVSLTPTIAVSGSPQPLLVTVDINDPDLVSGSVNLIEVSPSGQQLVLGVLHDDGSNGDFLAGDGRYSLRTSAASLPVGDIGLFISAAFRGSLKRVQTEPLFLTVVAPISTGSWVSLSDSSRVFTIIVPPEWHLSSSESTDGGDRTISFTLADGELLFNVDVYTKAAWLAAQQEEGPQPVYLGETSTYVLGYSDSGDSISFPGLDDDVVRTQLTQVLATIRAN